MRKILIIHNAYRNIGGEDVAVQNEVNFLKKNYEVRELYFDNSINPSNFFSQTISFFLNANRKSLKLTEKAINEFQPDLAYVHNTWFKASVAIFKLLKKKNIKTVIKIHNFRYSCTKSYLIRKHLKNEETCLACGLQYQKLRIFNKYFEDSYLKSFFIILYGRSYFKVIKDDFFKLFVLTKFHKEYLSDLGISEEKVFILPNTIQINNKLQSKSTERYLLYAGRISAEKGVDELINTFTRISDKDLKLKIIGDGPILRKIKNKYKNTSVEFLGEIPNNKVIKLIEQATAIVTATKLFEGQPTLLCEASSLGIPSIFPDTGGVKEFFPEKYQLSYEQFNFDNLEEKLALINDKDLMSKIGNANKKYLNNYLDSDRLLKIFQEGSGEQD